MGWAREVWCEQGMLRVRVRLANCHDIRHLTLTLTLDPNPNLNPQQGISQLPSRRSSVPNPRRRVGLQCIKAAVGGGARMGPGIRVHIYLSCSPHNLIPTLDSSGRPNPHAPSRASPTICECWRRQGEGRHACIRGDDQGHNDRALIQ